MFRKLVSNLPFSPALVGQIGFYARRLRKEEATRRAGLFMTVLALVVQSLTVFVPSTSANSRSGSDLISGGVTSKEQILAAYDNPNSDFKKIMTYAGITRNEIQNAVKTNVNSRQYGTGDGQWLSWGRNPRFSAAQGEVKHTIDSSTTVYSRPLWRADTTEWTKKNGSTYTAIVGKSAIRGDFAILFLCGNLATRTVPPPPTPITVCRPGVGVITIMSNEKLSTDLPANSPECQPKIPAAVCKSASQVKIDRTHFNFKATASTENGATVSSYVFTIRKGDASGTVVTTKTVNSTALTAESGSIELKDAGTYHVSVTVKTSAGDKTSADCTLAVTVAPEGKITVCRPGVGVITIFESEKKSTDLPADSEECKPKVPEAICSDLLEPIKIDRTHYNFKAKAEVKDGAKVSAYVFTVRKDSKTGPVVLTKTVNSTALTAESGSIELKDAANYFVNVTIKTSVGDKTSDDCNTSLTVAPPEMCEYNPKLLKNDPDCKPCAGNNNLWYKDPHCREVIVESKTAVNLTQGGDASKTVAHANDRIQYTLTITNPGKVPAKAQFTENLDDVLEYSTIQNNGGGTYDPEKKTLSWPEVTLEAGEKQTRTFIVALPATIPTTAQGSSEPLSYDCVMNNTFGNNVQIRVNCETPKVIEQTVKQLPATGPGENMLFAGVLAIVVTFFWARSKQLGKEVRLDRKEFSASSI